MDNEENIIDNPIVLTDDNKIKDISLSELLENDLVKQVVETFISTIGQSAENEKLNTELRKKELQNQIELRKFDIKEQELEVEFQKEQNKYFKSFDITNKIYIVSILIIVVISVALLNYFNILDKSEARIIIVIALTIGLTSNTELIKNIFNHKKQD